MVDGEPVETGNVPPLRPGERLRDARVSQGLTLDDVAARTRIPMRHLEAIETGDYSGLPSATYAMGFSKSYARAVGLDEVALAKDVRAEIAGSWDRPVTRTPYEIADPKRVPSPGLALGGIVVAVLLVIGAVLWFATDLFRGGTAAPTALDTPVATVDVPPPGTTVSETAPTANGQVTLTATDAVWMRVYDATGKTLVQKEMKPGERYDVPGDANGAMINVGRPDKLDITVNGSGVPPLGDGRIALKDVPITAAALLARAAAAPPTTGNSTAAP